MSETATETQSATPSQQQTSGQPTSSTPSSSSGVSRRSVQLRAAMGGLDFASQAALLSPVQMHGGGGGEADVHAAAAEGIAGSGGAIPHAAAIQRSFGGHDVSGIQAHVGGAAAGATKAMGAEAYATGSHVAFGSSPSLHTAAHEAAHVVQQRAGVSLSGGVGAVGDRYEQHADAVADAVVAGKDAAPILNEMTGGGGGGGGVQQQVVQRETLSTQPATPTQVEGATARVEAGGGTMSAPNAEGQIRAVGASAAVDAKQEERAKAFELALGRDAYGKADGPAATLAGRAKAYLTAKAGKWEADNAELKTMLESLGSDATWCGAVGKDVGRLMAVFDSGNVRMRMNHIGNFYSNILEKDVLNEKDTEYEAWLKAAKIRVADFKKAKEKAALESEVSGQKGARVWTGEDANMKATSSQMATEGMPLHDAEKEAQKDHAAEKGQTGFDIDSSFLAWNQGAKVWAVNEANAWVAKQHELNMPVAAGPSGTTKWLMTAATAIGGVSTSDARLACIGYLLPLWHHSLSEIMAAAAPFGLPYTPGPAMYRSITPWGESAKAFGGGKWPDEAPEAAAETTPATSGTGGAGA